MHYRPRQSPADEPRVRPRRHLSGPRLDPRQFHHLVRTVPGSARITWIPVTALEATWPWAPATPLVEFARETSAVSAIAARLAGWRRVRGPASRRAGRRRSLAADRPGTTSKTTCSIRLRGGHGRAAGPGCGALGLIYRRAARMELRGEVVGHPRVRRFRPSSHGRRADDRRRAPAADGGESSRFSSHAQTRCGSAFTAKSLPSPSQGGQGLALPARRARLEPRRRRDRTRQKAAIRRELPALVESLVQDLRSSDRVVIMSNGGFGGLHSACLRHCAPRTS